MQRGRFQLERNGAREKPGASAPKFTLDIVGVVIEGMTKINGLDAGLEASSTQERLPQPVKPCSHYNGGRGKSVNIVI